jgi:hypothetical protein
MGVLLRMLLSACALGASLLAPAAAAQPMLVADGGNTAVGLGNLIGRVITFICPSTATTLGQVWGSEVGSTAGPCRAGYCSLPALNTRPAWSSSVSSNRHTRSSPSRAGSAGRLAWLWSIAGIAASNSSR